MTKETAHQRNFREMAEREKLEAAKALSYPNALLAQLARCSDPKYDFDIKVVQVSVDTFAFNVSYLDRWSDHTAVTLTNESTWGNWDALETLESEINAIEQARAEEKRQYDLRVGALAKLTDEEKIVLGL